MIAELFKRLRGQATEQPLPELDARLGIIVLLVRLAKADHHYAVEEIQLIDRLIAGHLDLNAVEAAKLRATSEKLEATAPDTAALSAMVQGEISEPDRHAVLDALWQVGLADRSLKPEEEGFLTEVARALGLDPAEGAARHRTAL
jgi:uncharacterized tellurite resistance protein B-like protein